MNLHQTEILKLLHDLDDAITTPVELILCGGAAGILLHSLSRATLDIDVVYSSHNLVGFKSQVEAIATRNGLGPEWINSRAAQFSYMLPDDFRTRIKPVESEFRFLKVSTLSRGDLLFMKLSALRPEDVKDAESMSLDSTDLPALKSGLDKLRMTDPNRYYLVRSFLLDRKLI